MTRHVATAAEVEAVRAELQRLGYLSHRVERYLLQDALRPERVGATVTVLAAKLGLLGGSLVAVGGALLLLAWNPPLVAAPLDLAVLVLHLLPVSALVVGVAFLVLAGVLAATLRLRPALRIDSLSLVVGIVGGVGLLGWVLWRGRELLAPLPLLSVVLLGVGGAGAAYLLGRLLYQGLLALAIRLTDRAPRRRLLVRRYLLPAVAVVALALVALPAAVAAGRPAVAAAGFLPTVRGERVLLIGVDGVLPGELDYLLKRGALPALAGLQDQGGAVLRYPRDAEEPPAAFWTTVATGLPSPQHGVAAVDSFRPAGMETALAVNGPFRWYWAEVARPLGLARQRPLLSNRRSAFTFWELVGRGGAPVVAVDWWGTYPASPSPGLVVAHGGYQLLAEGAEGAVAPPSRQDEVAELRRRSAAANDEPAMAIARAALPQPAAAELADRALLPERFYRDAFARDAARQARAAALYLPAVDIAADSWRGGDVAFAELVAAELQAADRMLSELLAGGEWGTVLVVIDPGRRGGGEGRALLWRRGGCNANAGGADAGEAVRPEALAAGLFRAAGLPQSAELPAPPEICPWPTPPASVSSYGRRDAEAAAAASSDEYLRNLRSLGYV
ncbi:MAG TPA: hypothetical protein VFS60_12515 [Thermoanaerobaculia bacterium]|nr:hypothetical protein [Thermoanaerobaculia bacterium]